MYLLCRNTAFVTYLIIINRVFHVSDIMAAFPQAWLFLLFYSCLPSLSRTITLSCYRPNSLPTNFYQDLVEVFELSLSIVFFKYLPWNCKLLTSMKIYFYPDISSDIRVENLPFYYESRISFGKLAPSREIRPTTSRPTLIICQEYLPPVWIQTPNFQA